MTAAATATAATGGLREGGPRVFVAGHRGMVGAALVRRLQARGYGNIVTAERAHLDLTRQAEVEAFFAEQQIDQVYVAAAKVGGILANQRYPADFIYQNLLITANVVQAAHKSGVARLMFLGSSCSYPRQAAQPMAEEALLNGPLEPTNAPYALAKIAGITLCDSYRRQYGRDYRCVMPTNLYGPMDNFHPEHGHVVPALLQRFHAACQNGSDAVHIWGSGQPRREFMHVDDMAAATLHLMELPQARYQAQLQAPPGSPDQAAPLLAHINVGTGVELTIAELAASVARISGFGGRIWFDSSRPDGAPCKRLDVSRLAALGWRASIGLEEGLRSTYAWYCEHLASARCA